MAEPVAQQFRQGRRNRRAFFATMPAFGLSTAGAAAPGSTVLAPFRDPRLFDGHQIARVARLVNEYPVRWTSEFSFEPWLPETWAASDDARTLMQKLRQGVTCSNGDIVGVGGVIHNITRWCEADVAGNSMASRFGVLVDPSTQKILSDALEKVDDHSIRIQMPRPDITLIAGMTDDPALIMHRSCMAVKTRSRR